MSIGPSLVGKCGRFVAFGQSAMSGCGVPLPHLLQPPHPRRGLERPAEGGVKAVAAGEAQLHFAGVAQRRHQGHLPAPRRAARLQPPLQRQIHVDAEKAYAAQCGAILKRARSLFTPR